MTRRVTIVALSYYATLCLALGSTVAHGQEGEDPLGVVIWKTTLDDPLAADLAIELMEEVNIQLIIERSQELPTPLDVLESLAAYRAMAVVWHDHNGTLMVLFKGGGEAQVVAAEAGSLREEMLYLREILRKRMGNEDFGVSDLLVTVPGETVYVPLPEAPAEAVHGDPGQAGLQLKKGRWLGGVGYGIRFHPDAVLWVQHGICLTLPAFVFDEFVTARVSMTFGIPAVIGGMDYEWLEISTVEGTAGLGVVPVRFDKVSVEMGIGGGVTHYTATAYLVSGNTQQAKHLSGHGATWLAAIWDPRDALRFRLYVDSIFVFRPPSFSIRAEGDFGSFPWQFGAGMDIEVAFH